MVYCSSKPIERVVYCLNNKYILLLILPHQDQFDSYAVDNVLTKVYIQCAHLLSDAFFYLTLESDQVEYAGSWHPNYNHRPSLQGNFQNKSDFLLSVQKEFEIKLVTPLMYM